MTAIHVNQIQYTTDYSRFKEFKQQREFSQRHIDNLVSDPTFPEKFHTSPIVVCREGTNFKVIDGNHRLAAAKKLKIPIYYIIDKFGTVEDMKRRNSQCKTWSYKDYLQFYVTSDYEDYVFIKHLMKEFHMPLTFVSLVIQYAFTISGGTFAKLFKNGELKIMKAEKELHEFFERVIPVLKDYVALNGKDKSRPLFTQAYWGAYVHFFRNDKKIFERFFDRLIKIGDSPRACLTYEDARKEVERMSRGPFKRLNKETSEFLEELNR